MYQNVANTDSAGIVYISFSFIDYRHNFYFPKMTPNDVLHFPFSVNVSVWPNKKKVCFG